MATVTLNGLSSTNDMTCLSFAPTILEVSTSSGGTYTTFDIEFDDAFTDFDVDGEYHLWVNDVTLTSVTSFSDATGYRYYVENTDTSQLIRGMISTIRDALKRVGEIAAGYDVYMLIDDTGIITKAIRLVSREYGYLTPLTITTDMPHVTITKTQGSSNSEFLDGSVSVDVYKVNTALKYGGDASSDERFACTLSKHVANDDTVRFDLGTVFASLTEDGEASQFSLVTYLTNENYGLNTIGKMENIYNVNGYLINQGGEFIPSFDNMKIAMNMYRGDTRDWVNNTILYVYEPTIPLSFLVGSGISSISYTVRYVGSDGTTVSSLSLTSSLGSPLSDITISLIASYLRNSRYVDIEFEEYSLGKLRFDVIKPYKANSECERIYWRNSWGGISFFDFTGNRTEERKVDIDTYQESILNYYADGYNERDFVYSKETEISVSLTTHNILKDGQWQLFDLQQSRNAWVMRNGERFRVLVDDVTINETSVTDIYTATVSYTFSMGVNI